MKRKPRLMVKFDAVPLRRVIGRLVEQPAVGTAIEKVRLGLAPTVAKVHEWCSQPPRQTRKKGKRSGSDDAA